MRYRVSKGGLAVLEFAAQSGTLRSTAPRPQGMAAVAHPFIDGQALDAGHEATLAQALSRSSSAAAFIAELKRLGFDVREGES